MAGTLVVRLSAIGDIVHAIPAVRALRAASSAPPLYWLVERPFADFVRATDSVDEVIEVDTRAWRDSPLSPGTWGSLRGLRRRLSALDLDLAIDAQGLLKSAVAVRASGARRRLRLPKPYLRERGAALLIREEAPVPPGAVHVVDINLALAAHLGADVSKPTFGRLFTDHDAAWADGAWAGMELGGEKVVMLWPGANWVTKRWPPERFIEAARDLVTSCRVVIGWGPAEKDICTRIADAVPEAILAPETGITQLAAFTSHCDLFVGGDTGPLHMAAALGVPTVGIYGPTSPERNGPYGNRSSVLYSPCAPGAPPCHKRRCRDWRCVPSVEADAVTAACRRLLEGAA